MDEQRLEQSAGVESKSQKTTFILLAIGLQLLILVGTFLFRQYTLVFGAEIELKPRLYDPRDIFYGDYVQLDFGINRYRPEESIDAYRHLFQRDRKIYAVLQPYEDDWRIKYLSFKKPSKGPYLRGKVVTAYGEEIRLHYGFEKYFVEEETGHELERALRNEDNNVRVTIAVGFDGRAVVKSLTINDQPFLPSPKDEAVPDRF